MNKKTLFIVCAIILLVTAGIFFFVSQKNAQQANIIIEWSTATELDTAGFNIYRGIAQDLINQKVNTGLISPAVDPLQGGSYRFVDQQVIPGTKYFYVVEEVDQAGKTSRFGPIEVTAVSGGKVYFGLGLIFVVFGMISVFLAFILKEK